MSTGKNNTVGKKGAQGRSDDGLSKVKSLFGSGFSESKGSSSVSSSTESTATIISEGTEVEGTLKFSKDAVIRGTVRGEIISGGTLTIDKSAKIFASIDAQLVRVFGQVEGDIKAEELSLASPAIVSGNILAKKLRIEEGVVFEGKCSMTSTS